MSLINASANGEGLIKTAGCDGCPDASAVSEQQISGSGALAFVASESASLRFVGLGTGGMGSGAGDINFALRLQNGVVEVRESGAYKAEARFAAGDTFGIAVDGCTGPDRGQLPAREGVGPVARRFADGRGKRAVHVAL